MDRQFRCSTKIFVLTGVLFLTGLVFGQNRELLKQYDSKIRKQSVALDSIRVELKRGRERIKDLEKKHGYYLTQLKQLEKNMLLSESYLEEILGEINVTHISISSLKDSLVVVSEELGKRQNIMRKRLRMIHMTGNPSFGEILFTSININELLRRVRYFQELNKYDKKLLYSINSTRTLVEMRKHDLELEQDVLVTLRGEKESEHITLAKEQVARKELVLSVRKEKSAYETMVSELEQSQAELNMLLVQLEKRRKKAKVELEQSKKVAFEKRKGKLLWPVDGEIVKKYGKITHPIYKTVVISNGIDIKAPKGEKIFSVAPGQVDYIGWMRGYGKFVIINHFGGYLTIYGHLNDAMVKEDQVLKYGQLVGTVGETGSFDGAKLHFQIRHSTKTLDPQKWLLNKVL